MKEFRFWCQKVLPLVFDQSLSYYEVLCKIAQKLNELIAENNRQQEMIDKIPEIQSELDEINQEIEAIKNGEYIGNYIEALQKWIDENLIDFVGNIVKYVFFGLTDDGHFAAYIPQSWAFIRFDTGYDPTNAETYGHLLLWY